MKRALLWSFLVLCLLAGVLGSAERGQKLLFRGHILGDSEEVSSETLAAGHEINWMVVCSADFLRANLDAFESLDGEVYAEDALMAVVPSMEEEKETELDEAVNALNTAISVIVLSKDARVNAKDPVTCFVASNGLLLANEMPGDPFASEMLSCYQELKLTEGEGFEDAEQTAEAEAPAVEPRENGPATALRTSGNGLSVTGTTLDGEGFDSVAAFASGYVNAFAVCENGTLQSELDHLSDIAGYCAEQLNGANFFILVKGGELSELREAAMNMPGQPTLVLADEGPLSDLNEALYLVDWDGQMLAGPMQFAEEEGFCYQYGDLLAQRATDALNGLKGRKLMPLLVTGADGEKKSTDDIFAESRLTVVNIWETTCDPCLSEMSDLSRLNATLAEQGGKVVGFLADRATDNEKSIEELISAGQQLMSEHNGTYESFVTDPDIMKQVPFTGTPVTLFVDREGQVVANPVFGAYMDQVEKTVESLLK